MISIEKGVVEVSGTFGSNYCVGDKFFEYTDNNQTKILIDMRVIRLAITIIKSETEIKTIDELMQFLNDSVGMNAKVRKCGACQIHDIRKQMIEEDMKEGSITLGLGELTERSQDALLEWTKGCKCGLAPKGGIE